MVSAQNLPKPGGSKEIIDPYVVIQLCGAHEDKQVFKTKVVSDNGEGALDGQILLVRNWCGVIRETI